MKASKEMVRAQRAHIAALNRSLPEFEFIQISPDRWEPSYLDSMVSAKRIKVFQSRRFLVQVFEENGCLRISVNRTRMRSDGRWEENISWNELQEVKDAIGYEGLTAIEIFPPKDCVVDVANMRHLWILPSSIKLPCIWRENR